MTSLIYHNINRATTRDTAESHSPVALTSERKVALRKFRHAEISFPGNFTVP